MTSAERILMVEGLIALVSFAAIGFMLGVAFP